MFERFSDDARRAVVLAQEQCVELRHDRIGPEHLLLGIAAVPGGTGAQALADAGSQLPDLRRALLSVRPEGAAAPAGHVPFSPAAKEVLDRSLHESQRRSSAAVSSGHVLLALLGGADGELRRTLAAAGIGAAGLTAAVEARLGAEDARPSDSGGTAAEADRLDRIEDTLADLTTRLDRIERLLGGGSAAQG